MRVKLKVSGQIKEYVPSKVLADGELQLEENSSLSDVVSAFKIPDDEPYVFIVNNKMIPHSSLAETALNEGDSINLIPPIRGG